MKPVESAVMGTVGVSHITRILQALKMWLVPGNPFLVRKGAQMLNTLTTPQVQCWKEKIVLEESQMLMPLH